MTLAEFEQQIFAVAMRSPICDIPAVRRLASTSIATWLPSQSGRNRTTSRERDEQTGLGYLFDCVRWSVRKGHGITKLARQL